MNFFKKESIISKPNNNQTLKILIADDEVDVHILTKTILSEFTYEDKKLEFLSAYSGIETISLIEKHSDVVLVLLDVIMETDDAGLIVANKIRNELNNKFIQIILRTGQPSDVPEVEVVKAYEINDYKEKAELTSNQLMTAITTAIRSYKNIIELEKSKNKIIELNYEVNEMFNSFNENIIAFKTNKKGFITYVSDAYSNLTGIEKKDLVGKDHEILISKYMTNEFYEQLWETIESGKVWQGEIKDTNQEGKEYWLDTIITPKYDKDGSFLNYTGIAQDITSKKYIEAANQKIEILNNEIEETQKEVVFKVGAIAETRSKETGMHVKRVAEYSKLLALLYGLDSKEAETLKQASPMHDIGKIAIPDNILNKPGKLTKEEFEVMKTHTQLGYEMLKGSTKYILKVAAIVAYEHQEKYDGSGYPQGLQGEDIHIYGRITAVADVFDALGSDRCYKKAWKDEEIFTFFRNQSGIHFDPVLVNIFFENLNKFLNIRDQFVD